MKNEKIICLQVLKGEQLVGVVTEADIADLAGELLLQKLSGDISEEVV